MSPFFPVPSLRWLLPTSSAAILGGSLLVFAGGGAWEIEPSPSLRWLGLVVSGAGFVATSLLGRILLARWDRFQEQLSRFAEGDLSERLPHRFRIREFSELARSINSAGEAQCAIVNELQEATMALDRQTRKFSSTFEEILALSRDSLDASSTVAAAVEELTTGMASMSKEANHVDGIASDTLAGSRRTQELAADTTLLLEQQEGSLRDTRRSLTEATRATESLEASGKSISDMAAGIQDVAKRTRLLALNASIEAVRAGRAGAGFSVVAHEVKELARQAGELAQKIQAQVDAVTRGTREVADRIQLTRQSLEILEGESASSRDAAQQQLGLARATQDKQRTTCDSVSQVARTIDESRLALGEIARSTLEVQSRAKAVQVSLANSSDSITDLQRLATSFQGTVREVKVPAPYFAWSTDLELGIPRMDDQHRVLLRLINRVADLSDGGGGGAAIRIVLGQLVDYTKFHFADEETLMRDAGYPALDAHHELHVAFVEEVGRIVATAGQGDDLDASSILAILKDWLTKHIQGTHRQYARHILSGSKR